MPFPFNAEVSITGHPRMSDNLFKSILSPFFSTMSIIFNAITVGMPSSNICVVKYKFLSILDASTILIIASGLSSIIKLRVTTSSRVYGDKE